MTKTCFVAIPYGIKIDPGGFTVDFDKIYAGLIKPVLDEIGYSAFRIDDVGGILNLQQSIIESVLTSDLMIADLTTNNPNVMYELGMRHMAKRGGTVIICSTKTRIPFDISIFRLTMYELDNDGNVTGESIENFRKYLQYLTGNNLVQSLIDSPVYLAFPETEVTLPEKIKPTQEKVNPQKKEILKKISSSNNISYNKEQSIKNLKEIQSEVLSNTAEPNTDELLSLLKNYNNISAFGDLIELYQSMPDNVKKLPEAKKTYALALNRMKHFDEAIAVINDYVSESGGDAEAYGILGRIYREVYENTFDREKARPYLDKAIDSYKINFKKQPNDYYAGMNVISLLAQQNSADSFKEIEKISPDVRKLLEKRMKSLTADYFDFATAVELSCITHDWENAFRQAGMSLEKDPPSWKIQTTVAILTRLINIDDGSDKSNIHQIIQLLEKGIESVEGRSNA